MKKAALVVGARPQFIKTAPLIQELGRFFDMVLIHTGQHYDFPMSGIFFEELQLPPPDYHLDAHGGTHGQQTGRMLSGLDSVLSFEKPEVVVVVGDTNSTLAGALAASKLKIPVVHVEAGVRSRDPYLPEQINRVVTDSIADCMLCPVPSAVENLNREGKFEKVFDAGDIIYDCLRMFDKHIPERPDLSLDLPEEFILATIHRAETVDDKDKLKSILISLGTAPGAVVFPAHPRTRKMISKYGLKSELPESMIFLEPVGYVDLLSLLKLARFVVTDSGGVQREAAYFSKKAFVARPETEWRELEQSGCVTVVGYEFDLEKLRENTDGEYNLSSLTRPASKGMAGLMDTLYQG
jgi:UDP-N-acetylglucosamine 2-epimerase